MATAGARPEAPDGAGRYIKDLPFEITERRWSRHDPNVFYYTRGNQLIEVSGSRNQASGGLDLGRRDRDIIVREEQDHPALAYSGN